MKVVQRLNMETLEVEWLVSLFVAEEPGGETVRLETWSTNPAEACEFFPSEAPRAAEVAGGFVADRPEPEITPSRVFAALEERGLA